MVEGGLAHRSPGTGGAYSGAYRGHNLGTYSVEYTTPDGTKLFYYGRNRTACQSGFARCAHGSKGLGVTSTSGHSPVPQPGVLKEREY